MVTSKLSGFIQLKKYYVASLDPPKYINLYQQNNGINQVKFALKVTITGYHFLQC